MRIASKFPVLGVLVLGVLLSLVPAAAWAQGPTITPIGNVTLNAGLTTVVNVVAVDPNGDAITLSVSGATFATLNAPTTGNGLVVTTLTLYPLAADIGPHTVTVTATANGETDTEDLLVQVNATGSDHAPVVVAPANQTVNEGQNLSFTVTATDADLTAINFLSVSGLPAGATFTNGAGNTSGTFSWTPTFTQAGSYDVGFTAANGLEGSAVTHIQVNNVAAENHPPDVTAPATLSVNEGVMVSFTATATDADADHVTLTASGVPSGAVFTDLGNNTATLVWIPSLTAAGTYTITVTGNDGHGGTDTAVTTLTVLDVGGGNVAPVVTVPATLSVNEGVMVSFTATATDANGDHVTLTASGVPSGATFVDNGNNTATFTWTPSLTASGTYTITVTGNDGHGGTATGVTTLTVLDVTGGGAAEATAKLLGKIHRHRKNLCFKITPVNGSFDPARVDLATITLNFNGGSIDALSNKTHISFECEGDDDDDDGGDCHECGDRDDDHDDSGKWGDHRGQGDGQGGGDRRSWGDRQGKGQDQKPGDGDKSQWGDDRNWNGGDQGENHDGDEHDCDGDGHDDGDDDSGNCVGTSVHACFSMRDVRDLFGDVSIADNLDEITITGNLTTGGTFEATVSGHHAGHGKDKDKKHHGHGAMSVQATPNPFNPQTILTFTLTQPTRVRVNIYDLRGALVKTLLNENRVAGTHTVPWDGTDSKQQRVVSGVYFVQVQSNQDRVVQRLTVLK